MKLPLLSPKIIAGAQRAVFCLLFSLSVTQHASAATNPADPDKVLRYVLNVAESGFDPGVTRDLDTNAVNASIFERLYGYDYLARPAKLIPSTADGMPEISADGKTYTIKLKKGIYFRPDAAFNGKPRELTMADYIYTIKRLKDPKLASPHSWLIDGKIVGLDELEEQGKKSGKYNYDAKVEGLELVDKYTLRIHLTRPDYTMGMILAHNPMGAVAREVIEKYKDGAGQVMDHPVGTGPYYLALDEWVRGNKFVLLANPDFRNEIWDFEASNDPEDQKIVAALKGRRYPFIGRIEFYVMLEDQSRWLAFQNSEVDIFQLEGPLAPQALDDGKLKPELVKKGIQLSRTPDPEVTMYYWNMRDPVWGGFSKEKIALRRAVAMAHNVKEEIQIVYNGAAVPLEYPIPPGVLGYDPNYKSMIQYNPAAANALLDKFGYKKGADGYRTQPNGQPLSIRYSARSGPVGMLQTQVWKKTYDSLGIRMKEDMLQFSELLKAERSCQLQTRNSPWIADYPDGDNFMQLFYGPNIGSNNNGCVTIPEYDQLYEQSQKLPPGPERDLVYHKMVRIMEINTAQRVGFARYRDMLQQARVIGYKKHPMLYNEWQFIDVEKSK